MRKKEKTLGRVKEKDLIKWRCDMIDKICKLPHEDICRIGHLLNQYEWPDDLPGKPRGWDDMGYEERSKISIEIFRFIQMHVGEKALLRYFHKTELGRTDQQFEDWWDSHRHKRVLE